ncbi:VOC family protein [Sorangium sp. So ce726]|uniref:VOC family protein n=1 Tax=Sorangium sp. So ce726 TaxID=3133319 RepID=UPI003F611F55
MMSSELTAAPLAARVQRKAIGVGIRLFFAWSHLAYRLLPPWGGKLRAVDHLTVPCSDLRVAERFYVGLLGARLMMRVDAPSLARMGRPADEIARSVHLTVVFAGGPRLDLFESPIGQPPRAAAHPHCALWVAPGRLLAWKKRLTDAGVPTYGPTRLGPPGQASLYFNDPFGNRLELTTLGFTAEIPAGAPDVSALDYTWAGP